jgi:glycosyltransferase involved in cell wall biosynthesis
MQLTDPQVRDIELTILMPCLNEALTLETCLAKARSFLERAGVAGELLVADNGSDDGSVAIAERMGARVVHVPTRGYGAALIAGIKSASGRFVIMGDSDDSYDFAKLDEMLEALRRGAELVMGNRFLGVIHPGAMPWLHRHLGNPVLSMIGRLFFRVPIGDFHCGLRGFCRRSMLNLDLRSPGMEFASEMVVKASLANLALAEVPVSLYPDGRNRPPHLRTWRDGWRHLSFLMMMSPRWLMLYPGLLLMLIGFLGQVVISIGPVIVRGVGFDIHTLLYSGAASVMGLQLIIFAVIAKMIGIINGVFPRKGLMDKLVSAFTLERGLLLGGGLALFGLALALYSVHLWVIAGFSSLDPSRTMRFAIPSVVALVAGSEIVFASFILILLKKTAAIDRFRHP